MRTRRPLIYVAHPMTTYGSPLERDALLRLTALAPDALLINPAALYATADAWLEGWPSMVADLSALVLVAAPDGSIGAGCVREVADAWALGIPVVLLDNDGKTCELRTLRSIPDATRTPARTAVVAGGRRVDLANVVRLRCLN